jgi:hypothetical protein
MNMIVNGFFWHIHRVGSMVCQTLLARVIAVAA